MAFTLSSLLAHWRAPSVPVPLQTGWEEAWFEVGVLPNPGEIPPLIRQVALAEGVDPALVMALVEVESGFDPAARSPRGAVGLMQVLPETAALVGVVAHEDPQANLQAGCRYLRGLFEEFGGDMELVLAAYNAGPGAVYRYGGVPPFKETQAFVARVAERYQRLSGQPIAAARLGFGVP
ncbi:MAG: lytic transglycosylase domain-containing protein [Thermoanaerobaculum sp.]|nr:lytic transglycosylase domain-containing protein [Thermoanaerobaculum sp.]